MRTPIPNDRQTGASTRRDPINQYHWGRHPLRRTNACTEAAVSAGFTLTTTIGALTLPSARCTRASCAPSIGHRFVHFESRKVSSTGVRRNLDSVIS
jgi:hypothetical protein